MNISTTVDQNATALFQFAEANGLALAPLTPNTKLPHGEPPWESFSRDRTTWERWRQAGHNFALPMGPNRLIAVDIDPKNGGHESWSEWQSKHGAFGPAWLTRSGGAHVLFRAPEGDLRQPGLAPGLDVRAASKSYLVCPPSAIDGSRYLFLPQAAVHEAPPALAQHVTVPARPSNTAAATAGDMDASDAASLVSFLAEHDAFDSYEDWVSCGMACRLSCGDEGLDVWRLATWPNVSDDQIEAKWRSFAAVAGPNSVTLATFIARANALGWKGRIRKSAVAMFGGVSPPMLPANAVPMIGGATPAPEQDGPLESQAADLEQFYAYLPAHNYIFVPTREFWPASSVNARIGSIAVASRDKPLPANTWLDLNRAVEQITWAPGQPLEIRDRLITSDSGWFDHKGARTLNTYRAPQIRRVPGDATPWLDHIRRVYPDGAEHIVYWLAHRVQRPGEKVNHALVLGGAQGIGKDTLLEPIKEAVGRWNFAEIGPHHLLGQFNGFTKSVILRVNEAHDLGDIDRYGFYERMKTYTAAPPDVLRVNEKHLREYAVVNVCGVIITSNHKTDGLYLEADDRRHYVAWSNSTKEDFDEAYWSGLYGWYDRGGAAIVAHYLATLDLSAFNPKAPPPKTAAFWEIVRAGRAPEADDMSDALDRLGRPAAVTIDQIKGAAFTNPGFSDWLRERKNNAKVGYRLEQCGYVSVTNPDAKDGAWVVMVGSERRRRMIYARRDLPVSEQTAEARTLIAAFNAPKAA